MGSNARKVEAQSRHRIAYEQFEQNVCRMLVRWGEPQTSKGPRWVLSDAWPVEGKRRYQGKPASLLVAAIAVQAVYLLATGEGAALRHALDEYVESALRLKRQLGGLIVEEQALNSLVVGGEAAPGLGFGMPLDMLVVALRFLRLGGSFDSTWEIALGASSLLSHVDPAIAAFYGAKGGGVAAHAVYVLWRLGFSKREIAEIVTHGLRRTERMTDPEWLAVIDAEVPAVESQIRRARDRLEALGVPRTERENDTPEHRRFTAIAAYAEQGQTLHVHLGSGPGVPSSSGIGEGVAPEGPSSQLPPRSQAHGATRGPRALPRKRNRGRRARG